MRNRVRDLIFIYLMGLTIASLIIFLIKFLPEELFTEIVKYDFFYVDRFNNSYLYNKTELAIAGNPTDVFLKRPVYIFENKLLLLYYGYEMKLDKFFSPHFNISFDVYPERIFKKLYSLDGKIIAFKINFLRSDKGTYALDYKLDLSSQNDSTVSFFFTDEAGKTNRIIDNNFQNPPFFSNLNKLKFDLLCNGKEIEFHINKQSMCKVTSVDIPKNGFFNLVKYPGSQFLMDNLRIIDLTDGGNLIFEDFNKYFALFEVRDWFQNSKISFTLMFITLFSCGYLFDILLIGKYNPIKTEFPYLVFSLTQGLFLMTLTRVLSASLYVGILVVFSMGCAKLFVLPYACLENKQDIYE